MQDIDSSFFLKLRHHACMPGLTVGSVKKSRGLYGNMVVSSRCTQVFEGAEVRLGGLQLIVIGSMRCTPSLEKTCSLQRRVA